MNSILIVGIIFVFSQLVGKIFSQLKIPRILGYLTTGIILGPYVLGVLTDVILNENLSMVKTTALALIAFMVGDSLDLHKLKKLRKDIPLVTIFQSIAAFFSVFIGLFIFIKFSHLTNVSTIINSQEKILVFALLLGAINIATAPAAILAIISEYKSSGVLTSLLLGIVALDDAITIIAFSFVSLISLNLLSPAGNHTISLLTPFYHILTSIVIGSIFGFLLKSLDRFFLEKKYILGLSFGMILMAAGLSKLTDSSLILTLMTFGFYSSNFNPENQTLVNSIENIEEPIWGSFFVLAGAHLDFSTLAMTGVLALVMSIFRLVGKHLGSYLALSLSKQSQVIRKSLGLALMPQAGVAIALAFESSKLLNHSNLAKLLISTVMAATILNEIISPFLVKFALSRAGDISRKI